MDSIVSSDNKDDEGSNNAGISNRRKLKFFPTTKLPRRQAVSNIPWLLTASRRRAVGLWSIREKTSAIAVVLEILSGT